MNLPSAATLQVDNVIIMYRLQQYYDNKNPVQGNQNPKPNSWVPKEVVANQKWASIKLELMEKYEALRAPFAQIVCSAEDTHSSS